MQRVFGGIDRRTFLAGSIGAGLAKAAIAGKVRGCGMLVVNPPFGFDAIAATILAYIKPLLAEKNEGSERVRWLVPE